MQIIIKLTTREAQRLSWDTICVKSINTKYDKIIHFVSNRPEAGSWKNCWIKKIVLDAEKRKTIFFSKARILDARNCFWMNNFKNNFFIKRKSRSGSWKIVSGKIVSSKNHALKNPRRAKRAEVFQAIYRLKPQKSTEITRIPGSGTTVWFWKNCLDPRTQNNFLSKGLGVSDNRKNFISKLTVL